MLWLGKLSLHRLSTAELQNAGQDAACLAFRLLLKRPRRGRSFTSSFFFGAILVLLVRKQAQMPKLTITIDQMSEDKLLPHPAAKRGMKAA